MSDPEASKLCDPGLYGDFADQYENVLVPRHFESPGRDLLAMVRPATHSRLLDVGTGTGLILDHATEDRFELAAGIDPSVEMLRIARLKGHTRVAVAVAPGLPFPAGVFDAVTASFVLSHVDSADASLHDMVRVLASGGCLAASGWGRADDAYRETWLETVSEFVDRKQLDAMVREAIPNEVTFEILEDLELALKRAGLTAIRTHVATYEQSVTAAQYAEIRGSLVPSRIMADQLGAADWRRFIDRVLERLATKFSEPLTYLTTVNMATGRKP